MTGKVSGKILKQIYPTKIPTYLTLYLSHFQQGGSLRFGQRFQG